LPADNNDEPPAEVQIVRRLLFALAWHDCIRASWMLFGRRPGQAAMALAAASLLLEQRARIRDEAFRWQPILAPHHGLTVTPSSSER
jgi:hypothetical protein